MVELSTDEVIMNHVVVPWTSSSRQDLYVALVVKDDTTFTRGPITLEKDKNYKVTLVNPGDALLVDVQYAIEVSEGASFVNGACEGNRRTHGRLSDGTGHELVIINTEKEFRVVAAWAGGHEAVQLTEELVFLPANSEKGVIEEEKNEQVIGVQVVEKHEPHDVDAAKVEEVNVVERRENENPTNNTTKDVIAAEDAHKDALDAELQVLKDQVKDLGENHEDIQDKTHNAMQRAKQHYDDHHKEKQTIDTPNADRIQRFKDSYKEKHGDVGDDKHGETIKRFKDAYKEKHANNVKVKEEVMRTVENPEKHQDVIKRFKEEFRKKHGIADKKILKNSKDGGELFKRMQDAMNARGDVSRRQPPLSLVERVKRRYAQEEEESPVRMQNYIYGVVFFVMANICILQLCIWIGKRDKGRRHE